MSIDIEKERESAIAWAERHYRNVDEFTRNDLEIAVTAWLAAKSNATQPAPIQVQAGEALTDAEILRIAEDEAITWVTDERRPDNSTILSFTRAIIAAIKAGGQGGDGGR